MNDVRVMQTKIAQLQGEVKRLQRIAGNTRADRLLKLAAQNARQMVVWRFEGDAISRRACLEAGMSRRAWEWGRALLIAARIHDGEDLTETDLDACMEAIAVTEQNACQNGIDAVTLRLPMWARSGQNSGQRSGQSIGQRSGQNHVHFLPTSRENAQSRGVASGGIPRNRRQEIEQRHMEVNR